MVVIREQEALWFIFFESCGVPIFFCEIGVEMLTGSKKAPSCEDPEFFAMVVPAERFELSQYCYH